MQIEAVDIDTVHIDPSNVRTHPERNLATIKASLMRFGQQKPIVVDVNGIVRAGNGTLEAARALGWEKIDVVRTDLVGVDATAYAIADNRTGELAEWDDEALAATLKQLELEEFDIESIGFSQEEIGALLGDDGMGGGSASLADRPSLADRFLVPPFSVLDARQGYWQDRKRAWLSLGIQSELGRGGGVHEYSDAATIKRQGGTIGHDGSKVYSEPRMAMHNDPMQRKHAYDGGASPGGSPRPAMKTVDGHTVRGNGKGQPL